MAKKRQKRLSPTAGIFRDDQSLCMKWCHDNAIKIYLVPKVWNSEEYEIEIMEQGTKIRSGVKYPVEDAYTKVWELYCHYYDANNK